MFDTMSAMRTLEGGLTNGGCDAEWGDDDDGLRIEWWRMCESEYVEELDIMYIE